MNIKTTLLSSAIVFAGFLFACCTPDSSTAIVPRPQQIQNLRGYVILANDFSAWTENTDLAAYLEGQMKLAQSADDPSAQVFFIEDSSLDIPQEGYDLVAADGKITVSAVSYSGLFNGAQTLFQLVSNSSRGEQIRIKSVKIHDFPCYGYRGQHLDVARTYIPLERVEQFIDNISRFKINKLHFHLTDDEAWRVEIKSHPELTGIAAYRGGDSPIYPTFTGFGQKTGGFFTQEQLKSLVAYAALRNVEIIPEFDLPGHSLALGKVHPEFLCPVEYDWTNTCGYDTRNVLCATNENVYKFLDEIFSEIVEIFPSKHIHVGGDEVRFGQWEDCPSCSKYYTEHGFTSYKQLESVVMTRVEEILNKYGRSISVWNEAAQGDALSKNLNAYGWQSPEACIDMINRGYKTVIMPADYCYFDMHQSKDEPGARWNGVVNAEKTYSLNLDKFGYTEEQLCNVLGFEGAFWTELLGHNSVENKNYLDYQVFPRLLALSEVAWTDNSLRSWDDFSNRLEKYMYPYMDGLGIKYRPGDPEPKPEIQKPEVRMTTSLPLADGDGALQPLESYSEEDGIIASRCCRKGDWVLYEFTEPVSTQWLETITGYIFIPRAHFAYGHVEYSFDGETFPVSQALFDGRAIYAPDEPVKAVKIVCDADGNGIDHTVIHFPRIY